MRALEKAARLAWDMFAATWDRILAERAQVEARHAAEAASQTKEILQAEIEAKTSDVTG